jgi:hypothetical protein
MPTPCSAPDVLVIFDTCSLLDLIRHAQRLDSPAGQVAAASAVLQWHRESPGSLGLAVCEPTTTEFDSNIDSPRQEVRDRLTEMLSRVRRANTVAGDLGLDQLATVEGDWPESVAVAAEALARRILGEATIVPATSDDRDRAYARSTVRRPPARRGSHAMFDCIITESAMRIALGREQRPTWLLSSNTKDFCSGGTQLHPDLVAEFSDAGLEFTTSWNEIAGRFARPQTDSTPPV